MRNFLIGLFLIILGIAVFIKAVDKAAQSYALTNNNTIK